MTDTLLSTDSVDKTKDDNKNYLDLLVGDGKKFKDVEALARGKYESDQYIPVLIKSLDEQREEMERLRKEYLELKQEYDSRARLDDLLDNLDKSPNTRSDTLPNAANDVKQPTIDPKEIESLVSRKIQEHEMTRKEQENFNLVRDRLKERFGDNYQNILKESMEALGLGENFVNELARKHPQVFFKTFGIDSNNSSREQFLPPPSSSNLSATFSPKTEKRTWSYYQKMKRENPTLYWDPKTRVQMHRDALTLGDEFKDGDWHSS